MVWRLFGKLFWQTQKVCCESPYFGVEGGLDLLYWEIESFIGNFPVTVYLFKVDNGNVSTMCEICSKLTLKAPDRCR